MSVRVVARIRPLLGAAELAQERIVHAEPSVDGRSTVVRIPSPKNAAEEFKFSFNSVYEECTQEDLFNNEVAPNIKSLFAGLDVTIFAYGVTGTGKTHTMRGGTKLHDRGVIPRLLSGIYRRGRKVAKDSGGMTSFTVTLSYYEIYNDKVFDLFGAPDKRPPAGLPLREKDGKTVVVGLSEWACDDLKDFERLYIEANNNRSTAGTKLNAQSSRSHAILMVKVSQTTGDETLVSTASAIDLAGSEDNRRTENGKERMVESASINKSLFVLSQCIDAIGRGDRRIPYRESKMTRILSLGQNNGITIMILNLAPLRSYHLDTLSSLNVSSRAKRIEVREIENEVVFTQPPRKAAPISGVHLQRQPLKPLTSNTQVHNAAQRGLDKPAKAFSVYSDSKRTMEARIASNASVTARRALAPKCSLEGDVSCRTVKATRHVPTSSKPMPTDADMSATIERMVERKVTEIMANRDREQPAPTGGSEISEDVRRRLEELERKVEQGGPDPKAEGLRFLLMAKQHKERGEDASALKMYELALPFFPGQEKLVRKMENLRVKLQAKREQAHWSTERVWPTTSTDRTGLLPAAVHTSSLAKKRKGHDESEDDFEVERSYIDEDSLEYDARQSKRSRSKAAGRANKHDSHAPHMDAEPISPRTVHLLGIINSRDVAQIRGLSGVGPAKAKIIVEFLELQDDAESTRILSLAQLRDVPGMGSKTLDRAREGIRIF